MGRSFLTARWEDLILATYRVPDGLLEHRLAPGLELDRHQGSACASLVGFRFLSTRVFGVRWPWHTDFLEFNLRFYVRHGDRRGVMFVSEIVPRHTIAWTARAFYNEPYRYAPMRGGVEASAAERRAHYAFRVRGAEHSVGVRSDPAAFTPPDDSTEHFFKEHSWGFGRTRGGRLLTYEVNHTVWEVYPVRSHEVRVDWAAVYGPEWAAMGDAEPFSVVHARGSDVVVRPAQTR